jgi:hypothetical protein
MTHLERPLKSPLFNPKILWVDGIVTTIFAFVPVVKAGGDNTGAISGYG